MRNSIRKSSGLALEGAHRRPQALAARRGHFQRGRVPGGRVRALGELYLRHHPDCSATDLARLLRNRLSLRGVKYHPRTLRRQLSGSTETVPCEVVDVLRELALEAFGLVDGHALDVMLADAGLAVAEVPSRYVASSRVRPLAELWLFLTPAASKRQLARRVSDALASRAIQIGIDPLQIALAGEQKHVRREVVEILVELLGVHGISSEGDADRRRADLDADIARRDRGMQWVPPDALLDLVSVWKQAHREPSSRRLAGLLVSRLNESGMAITIHRAQAVIDGRTPRVRQAWVDALRGLVQESRKGEPIEGLVARANREPARLLDHCWVRADRLAEIGDAWLALHPSRSQRQLALRVAKTATRMGYSIGLSTVQSILGGHKVRCRGFVYRALLKQFPGRDDRIPHEDVLESAWSARALRRRAPAASPTRGRPSAVSEHRRSPRHGRPLTRDEEHEVATRMVDAERDIIRIAVAEPTVRRGLERMLGDPHRADDGAGEWLRRLVGGRPTDVDAALKKHRIDPTLLRHLFDAARDVSALRRLMMATWKQRDDARTELISSHMVVVRAVVGRYRPAGVLDHHDLFQEGCMGLMRAVDKFEVHRGLRFGTYAKYWVREAVQRILSERSRTIRFPIHVVQEQARLRKAFQSVASRTGRGATAAELSELTGIAEPKLERLTALPAEPVSLSAPVRGNGEATLGDHVADLVNGDALDTVIAREGSAQLRRWVQALPSREAWIVGNYFGIGQDEARTLSSLGDELGLTRERVRQLKEGGLSRLRDRHRRLLEDLVLDS